MRKQIPVAIIIALIFSSLFGEEKEPFDKRGTTAASFLKIGIGRPTGMGEAFVALSDDPSAIFYNPGGLTQLQKREVMFNYIDWLGDITHNYLSFTTPLTGIGVLGISLCAVDIGNLEYYAVDSLGTPVPEDDSLLMTFPCSDFSAGISFARMITDKLSFGTTVKGIYEKIWDMIASSLAIDLGLHYNTGFRSLRLGVSMSNFGQEMSFSGRQLDRIEKDPVTGKEVPVRYKSTPFALPAIFRFGIAYNLIDKEAEKLVSCLDLVHYNDINETFNVGLEYSLKNFLYLRGGYIFNTSETYRSKDKGVGPLTGLSGGLGLGFKTGENLTWQVNYNYRHNQILSGSHRITLSIGF
jgi:hypothetical protein